MSDNKTTKDMYMVYVNEDVALVPTFGVGDQGTYTTPLFIADASANKKQFPAPAGDMTMPWEQPLKESERNINKDANGVDLCLAGREYTDGKLSMKCQDAQFIAFPFQGETYLEGTVDLSAGHDFSSANHKFQVDGTEVTLTANCANLPAIITEINLQMKTLGIYHVQARVSQAKYVALISRAAVIAAGTSVDFLTVAGITAGNIFGASTVMGSNLPSIAINWADPTDTTKGIESYGCYTKDSELKFASSDKYVTQDITLGHYKTSAFADNGSIVIHTVNQGFMSRSLANPLRIGQIAITVNGHAQKVVGFSFKVENEVDDDLVINSEYRPNANLKSRNVTFELDLKDSTTTSPATYMGYTRATTITLVPIVITMSFTGRSATMTRTLTLTNMYCKTFEGPIEIPQEAGFKRYKASFEMGSGFTIALT